MSGLDYLHGAYAQEHIGNHILAAERRANAAQMADKDAQLAWYEAKVKELNQKIFELQQAAGDVDWQQVCHGAEKRMIAEKQAIFDTAHEKVVENMRREIGNAYEFAVEWVELYAKESSQEFLEGLKEGLKLKLLFSTEEPLRRDFMQRFSNEALDLYNREGPLSLTKENFDQIASRHAMAIMREYREKLRAESFAKRRGIAEPAPGYTGPKELREKYGEGLFKAIDFVSNNQGGSTK